jgi:hypothetical protein
MKQIYHFEYEIMRTESEVDDFCDFIEVYYPIPDPNTVETEYITPGDVIEWKDQTNKF